MNWASGEMVTPVELAGEPIVPERIIPGRTPAYLFQKHTSRYRFIREAVNGKQALDVGCGDGYGAYYLAKYASRVVGVDVAPEVVAKAQHHYVRQNLSFRVMDCAHLSFATASFDVLCAFEVFEHIAEVDQLIEESHRVLGPPGVFFVSTPNVESYVAAGRNPWHVKEYTDQEFYERLSRHFPRVKIYGQFCRRPLRQFLYQLSSRLYFDSRIYRLVVSALGAFYIRHIGEKINRHKTDWIESSPPGLFRFSMDNVGQADSFMAVCQKAEATSLELAGAP